MINVYIYILIDTNFAYIHMCIHKFAKTKINTIT